LIRDSKSLRVIRRILPGFLTITILASGMPAHMFAFQAVPGQGRNGGSDAQQAQQYDQQLQLQQQQQALKGMDVSQRSQDLDLLGSEIEFQLWQLQYERERMKAFLRENFQKHIAAIRRNSEELVQLTTSLQSDVESNRDQPLPSDMIAKTTKIRKLAHEIRTNMAGRKLPPPELRSTVTSTGTGTASIATTPSPSIDPKELVIQKTSEAKTAATKLRDAVEAYLASNNEQTVSVGALQSAAEKQHFDPNSVAILGSSLKLEQLSDEIRAEMRMVNAVR
jgi:hypothetical protein